MNKETRVPNFRKLPKKLSRQSQVSSCLFRLLNALPELVLITDSQGKIIIANESVTNWIGCEPSGDHLASEFLGKCADSGEWLPLTLTSNPRCNLILRDVGGAEYQIEASISPFNYQVESYFVIIGRPIPPSDRSAYDLSQQLYLAGLVSQLSKQNETLLEQVNTDFLTGALSRRGTEQSLLREIAFAQRQKQPLCCALVDIDNFKRINDRFGHAIGDQVLTEVVSTLRSNLRRTDYLGRTGGDEFLLILPHTDLTDAVTIVKRSIIGLANTSLEACKKETAVTVSAGVVNVPIFDQNLDLEKIIALTDPALKASKAAGKNTVSTFGASMHYEPNAPRFQLAN